MYIFLGAVFRQSCQGIHCLRCLEVGGATAPSDPPPLFLRPWDGLRTCRKKMDTVQCPWTGTKIFYCEDVTITPFAARVVKREENWSDFGSKGGKDAGTGGFGGSAEPPTFFEGVTAPQLEHGK